jgi:hypothetical protein
MPCPSYPPRLSHTETIRRRLQIMINFAAFHYLVFLNPNITVGDTILNKVVNK